MFVTSSSSFFSRNMRNKIKKLTSIWNQIRVPNLIFGRRLKNTFVFIRV